MILNIKQDNTILFQCGNTHKFLKTGLYKLANVNICKINNKNRISNFNLSLELPLIIKSNNTVKNIISNKELKLFALSNIEIRETKGNEIEY